MIGRNRARVYRHHEALGLGNAGEQLFHAHDLRREAAPIARSCRDLSSLPLRDELDLDIAPYGLGIFFQRG